MPFGPVDGKNKPVATAAVPGDQLAEKLLVAAAKAGDEQALETLFRRYQRKIFAVALRYTRVREDAEDIVQQTFNKAFVYLDTFEGKSSFATWLTRIGINQALMFLRRGRSLREVSLEDSNRDDGTKLRIEIADPVPTGNQLFAARASAQLLQ